MNIYYERAGRGSPVILLHAFAVNGSMWFLQVPALIVSGYDVICVDQRGHGQSSAPVGPYTITQMADDIHQLIAQLKLDRACVVGLSMGGRVAIRLALDHPQDVASLVLVSTKSEPAREIQHELASLARRAEAGEIASVVNEWYDQRYPQLAVYAADLDEKLRAEWREKPGYGLAGAARAIIGMESMTTQISEICAPTLAIAGALDTPCLPYVAWYERSITDCRGAIVAEASHFVNIEQPDRFNDLLLTHLSTQVERRVMKSLGSI